jgi:cytochrome c
VSRVRTVSIRCVSVVAVSLGMARIHPFGDAGLFSAETTKTPIMETSAAPADVREILTAKCADCHSMQTQSPIYGRFAPVSWLLERDIGRGREEMNLSRWESYSVEQRQTFAAKMVQETKAHEMPLLQYRMIHWNARVTDADILKLANWSHAMSGLEAGTADPSTGVGDPARGKALFEKRCVGCHSLTQNREGPRLQGVFTRTSGSIADYAYSPALNKAKIVWDEQTLDKWLTDPDALVPGNNMDFLVSKPQERKDLVSYLKQISGK